MTRMDAMAPAQYQAWLLLFELSQMPWPWVLVGGQMTALLAAEAGFEMLRPTPDADVLVDVRAVPGARSSSGTQTLGQAKSKWTCLHPKA